VSEAFKQHISNVAIKTDAALLLKLCLDEAEIELQNGPGIKELHVRLVLSKTMLLATGN